MRWTKDTELGTNPETDRSIQATPQSEKNWSKEHIWWYQETSARSVMITNTANIARNCIVTQEIVTSDTDKSNKIWATSDCT